MSTIELGDSEHRALVAAARAAPSIHNTQPWRFVATPLAMEVHADPDRGLRVIDPLARALVISCGAAVLNLRVALAYLGRRPRTHWLPTRAVPTHLATVRVAGPYRPLGTDRALYSALHRRRSSRRPMAGPPIPIALLDELREAAHVEGAVLHVLTGDAADALMAVARNADAVQRDNAAYREELGEWTTADPARRDGVPATAFGAAPIPGQVPQRDFTAGGVAADRPYEVFEPAPTLGVVSTRVDTVIEWLRAGTALQRLLLVATNHRLRAGFLTQPLELPAFRDEVRTLIGAPNMPQVVLRLGYGPLPPRTRRRQIREVLMQGESVKPT